MARKLASDKVLFVALVALSLFGCIMIYSASAVSVRGDGRQPVPLPHQADRALAVGGARGVRRLRAPTTTVSPVPWVVYGGYGRRSRSASSCSSAADQRGPALARARAVTFQPSEFAEDRPGPRAPPRGGDRPARPGWRSAPGRSASPVLTPRGRGHRDARAGHGHRRLLRDAGASPAVDRRA